MKRQLFTRHLFATVRFFSTKNTTGQPSPFINSSFEVPDKASANKNDQRMEKNKMPPRSGDEKPEQASFESNLKWMQEAKNKISPNPGFIELNASEFGSAMREAEQAEAFSAYYR